MLPNSPELLRLASFIIQERRLVIGSTPLEHTTIWDEVDCATFPIQLHEYKYPHQSLPKWITTEPKTTAIEATTAAIKLFP
jgi:hypothetical protein